MEQLPHLLAAVQRAVRLRTFVRAFATGAIVAGAASVWLALVFPRLSRVHVAVGMGLALLLAALRALRRRDARVDLVSYLDERLGAEQALVACEEGGAHARTEAQAQAALAGKRARDVQPRVWRGESLGVAFALAAALAAWSLPVPPPAPAPPGSESVTLLDAPALTRVAALPHEARDAHQRAQLERAATEAEALRGRLQQGLSRRDALDALGRVRDDVARARQPETPAQRRAREAAVTALATERDLAQALAERDLESLTRAVTRAAAQREVADRERAREALTRAAESARAAGDEELADSLLRQRDRFDVRAQQAALAQQLAAAMPETQREALGRQLERLTRDGDDQGLTQALVAAMVDAWQRLSPEERERLGRALADAQADENTRAAAEHAREAGPPTADEVEQQLRDALAALDQLQQELGGGEGGAPARPTLAGGAGVPVARAGAQAGGAGSGEGQGAGQGQNSGTGGTGNGGGPGPEGGETASLDADGPLLGRVRPARRAGSPSRSWVEWVDPQGSGEASGAVVGGGPAVAGAGGQGITRAPIPREYQDHVRAFFGGEP